MERLGGALVATTAVIEGEVELAARVNVWWNAVLRGDTAPVSIGEGTNIQDGVIGHVDEGQPLIVGREVTVGHGAVIHGTRIGDHALIGIGAVVLSGSEVGEGAIVAAGAVVPERMKVRPGTIVAGSPARFLRRVRSDELELAPGRAAEYWEAASRRAEA